MHPKFVDFAAIATSLRVHDKLLTSRDQGEVRETLLDLASVLHDPLAHAFIPARGD